MVNSKDLWLNRINLLSIILAFSVILLGAYTRLSDAGLGCPDWPGCYGQLTAPKSTDDILNAKNAFPQSPVDTTKAQTEMTHRYFAESLGLFIILFASMAFFQRKNNRLPLFLPMTLVVLVIGQGLLGMWTVTLKLLPIVVMSHLLGGFLTLALLWLCWLFLRFPNLPKVVYTNKLVPLAAFTLVVLFIQIALGGWTSANYAALICPDFPQCQGKWLPNLSLQAFNVLGAISINEPLSFMEAIEKTTIHVSHRLGAMITFVLGCCLSFNLWRQGKNLSQKSRQLFIGASHLLATLLFIQVMLGIANVMMHLPLAIAVAHNGIAVCLLLTLITINYVLIKSRGQGE